MNRVGVPRLAATVLAACAAAACSSGGGDSALRGANVLLIVVDTLGAAHLSCYGADTRSPNLDRLAREGARFERAYSTAPWTQPSVASLFTSRMPSRHGVRNLLDSLPDDASTLAEVLAANGYATHAVVSHFLIDAEYGFAQGFETFDDSPVAGHDGLSSAQVTDRAIELLDAKDERPFFLFAHYFDPHFRYNHHPEFDRSSDYGGNLQPGMPIRQLRQIRDQLGEKDLEYLVDLYREEIAFTDHHVGRLLDHLAARGLADDTVVVFTADHGEEFMEHGWLGHTRDLFDTVIRVPLIVRAPGFPGGIEYGGTVSTLDIAPTLLALVAPHVAGTALSDAEGHVLVAALRGEVLPERRVFAEVSFDPPGDAPDPANDKRAFKTAVIEGSSKLVHDEREGTWMRFDHAEDASETSNAFGTDEATDRALRSVLEAWEAARPRPGAAGDDDTDADELEKLRDLGYVH